jgi:hypothetical protein
MFCIGAMVPVFDPGGQALQFPILTTLLQIKILPSVL